MGMLYARAFTSQALLDAWAEVRDAALADGRPDAEVDSFEVDAARRLDTLGKALADGEWQASPVRRVELPKPSGGVRVLGVPYLVDRIVERALLRVLDPVIDPLLLPWSFAYRRGLGARLTTPVTSDPQVRRAQYKAADDEQRSRTLAAAFVEGKVGNLRVAVLRSARREDDADAFVAGELMRELAGRLPTCASLDEILGIEGASSREYFQTLRRMLDPVWGFEGRQRRPPPDPVNAMLSYGYTILTHEAIAAAEAAGLDPMVGFLHQHRWGRPALALDLMEEFRPVTVDVAMWRAISSEQIRPEQFENDPNQGCRMAADARHAFIAAYERRMLTLTTHQPSGRRVSYRVALSLQAKALARALLDPGEPYVALRWK
ncbi:CRISPR-associated endonuclease Cas1 [Frankia sp. Cppng1_Ct_nod]|uniref:CRISPR-associated endonuclease Cas1 n=1 Tax=Frankia sp. Cppng1_Ct_nod TaxID=2897162 RepID=UPI001041A864|nr:CRISPR-associated endonuclease Cas1 [Frankia sp. Cppng1_Ct_nod]